MADEDLNTFDFVVNDANELMLLIHAQDTEAKNARLELNVDENSALLVRNEESELLLEGLPEDIVDSLLEADALMVCEIRIGETDEDSEIVNAYEADVEV